MSKPSMLAGRYNPGVATGPSGEVFAFGGYDGTNAMSSVEAFDPALNTWGSRAGMPSARRAFAAAAGANGKIYVFGGFGPGNFASDVDEYSPTTDTWATVTTIPTPRSNLGAVEADGKIYTFGGTSEASSQDDVVEAYDPVTDTWTTMSPMLTPRSHLAFAKGADGRIYAISGLDPSAGTSFGEATNIVEAYDPQTDSWSSVSPIPTARASAAAALGSDGRIYVMGGYLAGDFLTTVEAYDPLTDTWATEQDLPTAREGLGATTGGDGAIYALGGELNGNQYLNVAEAFVLTPTDEPGPPVNVQANAGDGEATVTWTPPSSDGGSAITGYTITSEPDGISVSVGPGATQAIVPGLTNGTSYTFTVVATNAVGDSQASAPSNQVTPHAIDPPTEPRTPVASAGDQSATVTWLAPTSDGGDPIDSYTVTSNVGGFSQTVAGTQLSATITGLTNGTAYRFRVYATNAAGDGPASVLSNAVTPRAVPGPPRNVTATPGPARATVSWTPPASNGGGAINGYILTATSSSGTVTKTVAGGTTSTNITGLTNGVTYAIRVAARNVVGTGPASSPVDVTPIGVPGAPTGVTAVAGNRSASITWTAPASTGGSPITGYTVTSNVGGFSITVGGSETSAVMNGLTNGVAYRFRVFATNAVGNGPPSAYSIAVTPRGVPGPPTGVAAAAGNASATVSWTAPATGGSPITAYIVTSSDGQSTTVPGTARSALVGGLTNGVSYTFTVVARNAIGDGPPGTTSTPVTPSSSVTPIVFSSNRPGSSGQDIYVMNSDGSGVVRIVGRAGPDLLPALSPDGTRVVFASGVDTALELWMVNIDGSGLTKLTCNAVADSDPDWSPDGARIVFLSLRDGPSDAEVYSMAPQPCGSGTRLTDNAAADTGPSFSPDGSKIVFSSDLIGSEEIWVMNADGSSPTRLTTRAGSDVTPRWSPDGSRIAWTAFLPGSDYHLWAMDANGQNQVDLTAVTFGGAIKETGPAWSPDGSQIVVSSTRFQSPNYDIVKMQADGTGVVRLTKEEGNDSSPDW